jgi:hypothetical protein
VQATAFRTALAVLGSTVSVVLGGCVALGGGPAFEVAVDNRTDRPALLVIDGHWVGTYPSGTISDRIVVSGHGEPPWRLEAATESGVVLVAAEIAEVPAPGTGAGAAAETTCGKITIWIGDTRPDVVPSDVAAPTACD